MVLPLRKSQRAWGTARRGEIKNYIAPQRQRLFGSAAGLLGSTAGAGSCPAGASPTLAAIPHPLPELEPMSTGSVGA